MTRTAPYIGEAAVKRGLAKLGKTHTPGMCQREIRLLFGVPSIGDKDRDGDADAHDAWKAAVAKGKVVKDRKVANAPRGAYLYFSGGKHGHVALGLGGDDCVSTDAGGNGVWGRAKISALAKRWGRPYEGYIVVTGNDYRVFQEAPKGQTIPRTRYEVTASRLNARSGPGTNYPVKATRDKGFQFNSSKQSGDWVQASSHWYHRNYLKVVAGQPEPKPQKVTIRVGALNIPLDSAKLPDGPARAKEAAKQINASNLDLIGLNELDRSPGSTSHNYAQQLLKALGPGWASVNPKTAWNENYIFYRTKQVKLVKQDKDLTKDLVLPSNAGGRHATRATFEKNGEHVHVKSTHFVSGKLNGSAREQQGTALAEDVDARTVVLGDLNQKAVPKALAAALKTARDAAVATTNAKYGTYAKWSAKKPSTAASAFLDHILVPKAWQVDGYTVVGIVDNAFTQPRASDHFLIISSVTI